jgi:3-phosphoshikimate 1-carboxyvinyltransferase
MPNVRVNGPARALEGAVDVPGDKSMGHRALMFGALCGGPVRVRHHNPGEDNLSTRHAMESLGVRTEQVSASEVVVHGVGLHGLQAAAAPLDCGNAGTAIRLLTGLLAGQRFVSELTGDEYLRVRPMRRIVAPLVAMGCSVRGGKGKKADEIYPPLFAGGGERPHGHAHKLAIASAQVKSAILLAGLYASDVTTVTEPEKSRDHSERMLAAIGAPLTVDGLKVIVDPRGWNGKLHTEQFVVPGDLSSSAFLLAAGLVVPKSDVRVRGVGINPTRVGFLRAVQKMGGAITVESETTDGGEPIATLRARHGALRGIEIAGELTVQSIDELPILAVLAAFATGDTLVRDAKELRVKESDRIKSTLAMLSAFGVQTEEHDDGFTVHGCGGQLPHAGQVHSHGDHRIAMAGVVAALGVGGESLIHDTHNIATSFPTFESSLTTLGASLHRA